MVDKLGRFQSGDIPNPKGRPTKSADFVERLHHWITTHSVEEITKIYLDKSKFNKLSVTDGLCCQRLYEALQERGGNTMEQLFDRLLGKPSQHTTIDARMLVANVATANDRRMEAEKEAGDMLAAIAVRGANAVAISPPVVTIDAKPEKVRLSRAEHIARGKAASAARKATSSAARNPISSGQSEAIVIE